MLTAPEIPTHFAPSSKVWIYQSDRPFSIDEQQEIAPMLKAFAKQWTAHNQQLDAVGLLFGGRIILLIVDETRAGASGCSIDTSVHFIKDLEQKFGVHLFDRNIVNYIKDNSIHTSALQNLQALLEAKDIQLDTIVVDPLVSSKAQLEDQFLVTLEQSWMRQFI
ncbi:MAG: hypothetical protein R2794_03830 [Chitinophagales bacterium]